MVNGPKIFQMLLVIIATGANNADSVLLDGHLRCPWFAVELDSNAE